MKLSSMFLIVSDTVFIKSTIVMGWHFIDEETQVANSFAAFLSKLEMRVDVGFTPVASEGTIDVFIIDFGNSLEAIV